MFILNNTLLHLCKNFLPSITIIIMVSKQIHLYTVYKYSNIYLLCKQCTRPFFWEKCWSILDLVTMQTYESVDIGPNQVEYQLFKKKTMTYFLNEFLIFSGNCHRHLQN